MRAFQIIILLLFSSAIIKAQTRVIDSLKNELSLADNDSNKVNLFIQLGNQYDYFKSGERIENYVSALSLAQKINFKNGITKTSARLITNLSHRQLYDVALEYCNKYIDYLTGNGLTEELKEIYKLYATLLGRQGKYKESLSYNHKALNYYLDKNDKVQYATVLSNICLLHLNNNNTDSAYFYGLRAVEIFKENNKPSEQANSTLGLAEISLKKNDYKTAREKAIQALEIYSNIRVELGLVNTYYVLGNIDYAETKYDSSITHYTEALKLLSKFSLPELKRDCYLALSKAFFAKNNSDEAYRHHLLFAAYNDSVADEKFKAKALEMDAKYSITKTEAALKDKELTLQVQAKQRNFLILGIAGIFVLLLISYRGYVQKKKSNILISEQKKLVEEKQKEIIDSIKYAQRIQRSLLPTKKYLEKNLKRLND